MVNEFLPLCTVSYLLELKNINKNFGENKASDNVSLNIPEGSVYGLLGPNGAGKTTLIRMITTISKPDSGELLYNGRALKEEDAMLMGYMPEERGLYKKMNVMSQLLFFAEIKGMKKSEAQEAARYWLKRLEIETWAGKKLEELSKGMAQKVQFICTIIHNPKLIILDEPFSGFDPVNADLVKDLIIELNQKGSTILFSTHRMDNVEELCDHLCIINKGKIVLNGKSGTLRREQFDNTFEVGFLKEINTQQIPFTPAISYKTNDGRFMYDYKLDVHEESKSLLKAATEAGELVHFSEKLPTIHDIFVKTVTEEKQP